MARGRSGGQSGRLALEFSELPEGEDAPRVVVEVLDAKGETIHRAEAKAGDVSLSPSVLEKANKITLSSADAEEGAQPVMVLRATEVRELMKAGEALAIPRSKWGSLYGWRMCVDGSVSHCFPFPYLIDRLVLQTQVNELEFPRPIRPPFPLRCETVCSGLVMVYQRTCCCEPWIIEDPRIKDLIDRLKQILQQGPIIKWPPPPPPPDGWQVFPPRPGPGPDPMPPEMMEGQPSFFRGGTLSEAALHAEQDVRHLESLSGDALMEYVSARDYLRPFWCSCGSAYEVGSGSIRPDGTFHVCWRAPLFWMRPGCHHEYAFVVKQVVNGSTVTIYDGLAANKWFSNTTGIELVSYDRRAVSCQSDPPTGDTGAFAMLQNIGGTHSWRLKTPDQDTWDGVQTPAYNDGLLDPAPTAAAAKGNYQNSNWGGGLALYYFFSEGLRSVGARYYRISTVRADGSGNPTGARSYFSSPLSWLWAEITLTDIFIQSQSLGPNTAPNGEANLYQIPYRADHDWLGFQYHGGIDTTAFANDRHLIMLELFDTNGNRLRPNGASGPGNDTPFKYRRWLQEVGPTADVPFAGLTHMFWWDNRASVGSLEGILRVDGNPSGGQCQFLVGTGNSKFSADYRAYHPNEMFILQHNLWWKRGIGASPGSTGDISPAAPTPRYDNVGVPPGAPGTTPQVPFSTMLGPETRCSFALNLHVDVKTTNGSGVLTNLDADDEGAFAILT